jgi:hypothetical protein
VSDTERGGVVTFRSNNVNNNDAFGSGQPAQQLCAQDGEKSLPALNYFVLLGCPNSSTSSSAE